MHTQPIKAVQGKFSEVKLDFALQFQYPDPNEDSLWGVNYPTMLAYFLITLDGKEQTKDVISSTYMTGFLSSLLANAKKFTFDSHFIISSLSDPWHYDFNCRTQQNELELSIYLGNTKKFYAFNQVIVPLDQFIDELFSLSLAWNSKLKETYPNELEETKKDEGYYLFFKNLTFAKNVWYKNQL